MCRQIYRKLRKKALMHIKIRYKKKIEYLNYTMIQTGEFKRFSGSKNGISSGGTRKFERL